LIFMSSPCVPTSPESAVTTVDPQP
jgi:hypothetical protein